MPPQRPQTENSGQRGVQIRSKPQSGYQIFNSHTRAEEVSSLFAVPFFAGAKDFSLTIRKISYIVAAMKTTKLPRPTAAELEILGVLWRRGPSTVRQVHDVLGRTKRTGYTTVLKLMQIMAEKGLVRRNEDQRAHLYEARVPQEQTQKQLVGDLVDRAFGGSARNLLMQALSARRASAEDLAEIRKLLDEYERGVK
jgi:predicted transcriptional regulator